jgi:hypothetical protein
MAGLISLARKSFGQPIAVPNVPPIVHIEDRELPPGWRMAQFPPGEPIRPGQQPWEEGVPREIDFKVSANTTIQPRTNYGLVPFSLLRETYDIISEVKLLVHTLIKEALILQPQIKTSGGDMLPTSDPLYRIIAKPDGSLDWPVWLSRFYRGLLLFDAPCVYQNLDAKTMHVIQGDTVFPIVDQHGRIPSAPDPAYTQIIMGVAMQWFTSDEIWYQPMALRDNAPFGESLIEVAWAFITLAASVWGFELAHYKQGNMPEGWLAPPDDMPPGAVMAWESQFNARMSSGPAERNRVRVLPGKWTFIAAKKPDFPQALYEKAFNMAGLCAGISTAQWSPPHGSLGSKGVADMMTNQTYRTGVSPIQQLTKRAFEDFFAKIGADATFDLVMPTTGTDPTTIATQTLQNFSNGLATMNEARTALGLRPLPDGDVLLVIRQNNIISMTDFLASGAHTMAAGGSAPDSAADEAAQDSATSSAPLTSSDTKLAQRIVSEGKLNPRSSSTGSSVAKAITWPREEHLPAQNVPTVHKICGVDEGDDDYFGAPVYRATTVDWPTDGHANDVEIVAMCPPGMPTRAAIWKPLAGENPKLQQRVGGPQYLREQAAYMLDRTLGLFVVPVAYAAAIDGEPGAACMYVLHRQPPLDPREYDPMWIERAAVLDYLVGNLDRRMGPADGRAIGNWLTFPSGGGRPVLIDNGLTFPSAWKPIMSPFVELAANQPLTTRMLWTLEHAVRWDDVWRELALLVGDEAIANVERRLAEIVETGTLHVVSAGSTDADSSTTLTDVPVGDGEGGESS